MEAATEIAALLQPAGTALGAGKRESAHASVFQPVCLCLFSITQASIERMSEDEEDHPQGQRFVVGQNHVQVSDHKGTLLGSLGRRFSALVALASLFSFFILYFLVLFSFVLSCCRLLVISWYSFSRLEYFRHLWIAALMDITSAVSESLSE